ncbi:MAG: hypothetical protein EOO73_05915 [Myxococcales bacterium]|nr:MAG: hypothetical protein EOO73_05915 [Myxococcales bacterium]
MTLEHFAALIEASGAKKDDSGFFASPEGKVLTLYVSSGSATLSVQRIEAVRQEQGLVHAKTKKGELFVLSLQDVFAGAVEETQGSTRKAGFV